MCSLTNEILCRYISRTHVAITGAGKLDRLLVCSNIGIVFALYVVGPDIDSRSLISSAHTVKREVYQRRYRRGSNVPILRLICEVLSTNEEAGIGNDRAWKRTSWIVLALGFCNFPKSPRRVMGQVGARTLN